jgi:hypothetical protein
MIEEPGLRDPGPGKALNSLGTLAGTSRGQSRE